MLTVQGKRRRFEETSSQKAAVPRPALKSAKRSPSMLEADGVV
jgi:hypothetical protein